MQCVVVVFSCETNNRARVTLSLSFCKFSMIWNLFVGVITGIFETPARCADIHYIFSACVAVCIMSGLSLATSCLKPIGDLLSTGVQLYTS